MKVVFMAGGKGTRVSSVASDIPKPMIGICGKPVLEHEIVCLREQGFTDFIITVGHLGEAIIDYFGDGGAFGVHIEYYIEKELLGNAGALFRLKDKLTEDFLLLNADVLFDIDFNRFVAFHKSRGGLVTLFTHPNNHPYDSGLIVTDKNGAVEQWLTKEDARPEFYANRVNAGIHVISPEVLKTQIDTPKIDLDRQLLKPLAGTGKMFAYDSPEYVKDMGTPERYESVSRDFESGVVQSRNLRRRQKAIFLDRDGTINEYVGFLTDINDFRLAPGAGEAVKRINQSGYLAIVITNQPVIARGEVTVTQLDEIHKKMETLLGEEGAFVNAIYYCPHHPHKGYAGEVAELKIDCDCRKPKAGLLYRAAEDFNIDLARSWMIGDGETDVECGKNGGCHTAKIGENGNADVSGNSLLECVNIILGKENQ